MMSAALRFLPMLVVAGCRLPEPLIRCKDLLDTDPQGARAQGSNVLVIVSDDIGIDKTAAYEAHPGPARMPNLDELACAGVVFTNAYSNPLCSSSRGALMTGRHASRLGIGHWVDFPYDSFDLALEEVTLPEILTESPHGYTSAAVGKWHLVALQREGDALMHPNDQGFSYYAGSLGNPKEAAQPGHTPRTYTRWEKVTNGVPEWKTTYMTTDIANEAIARIELLPEPWFLYVAFNGAHSPLHVPPKRLITTHTTEWSSDLKKFNAMAEATDTEIGRVIASIPRDVLSRTTIIYLTDNGTPSQAIGGPWNDNQGKGTLYEGGVNVPLIVTGPFVEDPGRFSDVLVHFVDLFPTITEIAGVDTAGPGSMLSGVPIDGLSFLSNLADPVAAQRRSVVYSERFRPNGPPPYRLHHRMVTDGQWKLLRYDRDGAITEELYWLDPELWLDGADLAGTRDDDPEAAAAYAHLRAALDEHIEGLPFAR